MTQDELIIVEDLAEVWNNFLLLPKEHNDDISEFRHGIHQLQYLIMAREVRRKMKLDNEALNELVKRTGKSPLQIQVEKARGGPTPPPQQVGFA